MLSAHISYMRQEGRESAFSQNAECPFFSLDIASYLGQYHSIPTQVKI